MGQPRVADPKLAASKAKTDKEATESFIRAADQINLAEMELGKVAEEKAKSDVVKSFGKKTKLDHTLMNQELRKITSQQKIVLGDTLDSNHKDLLKELSKLNGAAFDKEYTKDMVAGHKAAIKLFENEIETGRNADLKTWAEKCLPTLREHLRLAQAAVEDVKKK